jgi:Ca-activated chloride channel family protein
MKFRRQELIKSAILGMFWLISLALIASGQSEQPQPVKGSVAQREVLLTVSVTDNRGAPIKGLKSEHFRVSSDKTPQEIVAFSDRDEPVSIALLIDASGSMQTARAGVSKIRFTIDKLADFIETGNEGNQYAIMSFDKEARLVLDWTSDRASIAGALPKLADAKPKGLTALYDACHQGLDLMKRAAHRKRVIILLSDGEDNQSKNPRFAKLRQAVRESDVMFFTINLVRFLSVRGGWINGRYVTYPGPADAEDVMNDLAKDSGGLSLMPGDGYGLDGALEIITLLLRNQYVIGFRPSPPPVEGKWRQVKVELKLPADAPRELRNPLIKHRAGYFDRASRQ